jgi:hypothetical protein
MMMVKSVYGGSDAVSVNEAVYASILDDQASDVCNNVLQRAVALLVAKGALSGQISAKELAPLLRAGDRVIEPNVSGARLEAAKPFPFANCPGYVLSSVIDAASVGLALMRSEGGHLITLERVGSFYRYTGEHAIAVAHELDASYSRGAEQVYSTVCVSVAGIHARIDNAKTTYYNYQLVGE